MTADKGSAALLPMAIKLARRELRGGLRGFHIFLACLTLGVATIAGVGSVSQSMLDGLRANGSVLLGGDLELRLAHRKASEEQLAWLAERGTLSQIPDMRTMARGLGENAKRILVELRAADAEYPLYGTTRLAPAGNLQENLALRDGAWGAVADPNLLRRLDVALGERVKVGEVNYELRAVLEYEPDKTSRGFVLGPTFMVAYESLAATGLEQPGSLIHYHYRLRLPPGTDLAAFRAELNDAFPEAGWRIRDTGAAAPGLGRFIVRLTLFMTLVGLTSLLVGGVGVGNAVRSYLDGKTGTIATLKCLGAPARLISLTYFLQVLALAAVGIGAGLAVGALAPFVVAGILGDKLGWQFEGGLYVGPLMTATAFGVLTAVAFSIWPLARARRVPAASLFREHVAPTQSFVDARTWVGILIAGGALGGLAVLTASDRWLAIYFVLGAVIALLAFRVTAQLLILLARRVPHTRHPGLRLAIANLHRPGSPSASVVMSLGLGLTVLVAIALIEGNLARWVRQSLPEEAPGFYFIDIQPQQVAEFDALVEGTPGVRELRRVPMLRGRITAVNGTRPDQLEIPGDIAWVFRGDRGLTWSREPPPGAEIVAGDWWPADYDGDPLVSLDADVGQALGIGPGDRISINVLGRDVEVEIANLRQINWANLTINFVMVFSPGLLESAPQTHLATVKADPAAEDALEIAVTDGFANVSAIRVKEAMQTFNQVIAQVSVAIRATAGVALVAGILVLAGAIAAGHRRRVYDAVVLKVLGATRRALAQAFVLEYGLLGLATAVISGAIGTVAAYFVLTDIMEMRFAFLPMAAAGTALLAVLVTMVLGFAGTWRALSHKAAPLLRNE